MKSNLIRYKLKIIAKLRPLLNLAIQPKLKHEGVLRFAANKKIFKTVSF